MSVGTRTSGLVQRVTPFVHHDRVEMNLGATQTGDTIADATVDPNSPRSVANTGGAAFDGLSAFGVVKVLDAIIWGTLPNVDVAQGGAWTIDLQDFVLGDPVITFTVNTGGLPAGITLNANGTFSGTVTNLAGAGQVTFIATNSEGSSNSGTLDWTIP